MTFRLDMSAPTAMPVTELDRSSEALAGSRPVAIPYTYSISGRAHGRTAGYEEHDMVGRLTVSIDQSRSADLDEITFTDSEFEVTLPILNGHALLPVENPLSKTLQGKRQWLRDYGSAFSIEKRGEFTPTQSIVFDKVVRTDSEERRKTAAKDANERLHLVDGKLHRKDCWLFADLREMDGQANEDAHAFVFARNGRLEVNGSASSVVRLAPISNSTFVAARGFESLGPTPDPQLTTDIIHLVETIDLIRSSTFEEIRTPSTMRYASSLEGHLAGAMRALWTDGEEERLSGVREEILEVLEAAGNKLSGSYMEEGIRDLQLRISGSRGRPAPTLR